MNQLKSFKQPPGWFLFLMSSILYAGIAIYWMPAMGPILTALAVIPAMAGGAAWGVWGGVLSGIFWSVIGNTVIFNCTGYPGWAVIFERHSTPGIVMIILVGAIVGYLHDLRNRLHKELAAKKQAEKAFRDSEAQYHELFKNLRSGVAVFIPSVDKKDFLLKEMNDAGHRIARNLHEPSSSGQPAAPLPFANKLGIISLLRSVAHNGLPVRQPTAVYNKEGSSTRWYENYLYALPTGEIVAVFDDITEEMQARIELNSNVKFLQILIDTIPSPVYYKDTAGKYLGCNDSFAQHIWGKTKEGLIGKTIFDVASPDFAQLQSTMDVKLLKGPGIQTYDASVQFADGEVHDVIFTKATFQEAPGKPGGIIGIMTDISERKKAEKILQDLKNKLEIKNKELLDFTHMVVHDIRKPITTMKTVCCMMQEGSLGTLNTDGQEAISLGASAIDYMQEMLEDLLLCARMEAGTQNLALEHLEMDSLVGQVVSRFKYQIDEKHILIDTTDLKGSLYADRKSITAVLMNLIGNAVTYINGQADPRITISQQPKDEQCLITISDNGIGIPLKCQPTIFDKFKRGTNVKGINGTGLGLAIAKSSVEAHGGHIWFESTEGAGTTFFLSLPCQDVKS